MECWSFLTTSAKLKLGSTVLRPQSFQVSQMSKDQGEVRLAEGRGEKVTSSKCHRVPGLCLPYIPTDSPNSCEVPPFPFNCHVNEKWRWGRRTGSSPSFAVWSGYKRCASLFPLLSSEDHHHPQAEGEDLAPPITQPSHPGQSWLEQGWSPDPSGANPSSFPDILAPESGRHQCGIGHWSWEQFGCHHLPFAQKRTSSFCFILAPHVP